MTLGITHHWVKEAGPRVRGSRPLDAFKVQAPGIARAPDGGFRLFYTGIGPDKPFAVCQGYILSAVSADGLEFQTEPGIRVAPQPRLPHMSLRVLAPSVAASDSGWRMYFEARGRADRPTVICSAFSADMLDWEIEEGIRLQGPDNVRAPRYLALPDGSGRLFCCSSSFGPARPGDGEQRAEGVISAATNDGLQFELEPGYRLPAQPGMWGSKGFSAAEVVAPNAPGGRWTMLLSAWEDAPPGTEVPPHPSADPDAVESGSSEDFAAASIASDLAGYRSRIYTAYSADGMTWERGECAIEGQGYDGTGLDAVHAEDMSLIEIDGGRYRMYYAACGTEGNWLVASAVSAPAT